MPSPRPETAVQEPGSSSGPAAPPTDAPAEEVAGLLAEVDRLRTVPGVAVSARFDTIRDGVRALVKLEDSLAANLVGTLTDVTRRNDAAALPVAYAVALAALSEERGTTSSTVQHALLAELRAEYAHGAERNYAAVADAFDSLVTGLRSAASVVDLRMAPVDVLHGSEEHRAAWLEAEGLAVRLDEHAALLVAAAAAAGAELGAEDDRRGAPTDRWLPLTVDITGSGLDGVRAAWDHPVTNAAGRWGAMLLGGFDLRAAPLADLTPSGRPLPESDGSEPGGTGRADGEGVSPPEDPPQPQPGTEVQPRISRPRAAASLLLGSLVLGCASACGVFAAGFTAAAVLEPHDVLLAALEALDGLLLLGAAASFALTWALAAAADYEARAGTVLSPMTEPARTRVRRSGRPGDAAVGEVLAPASRGDHRLAL